MRSNDPAILGRSTAAYPRKAVNPASRAASRVDTLLVALLCLCGVLCGTTTSPAVAARQSRSSCSTRYGCTSAAVLAHTSDSEAEVEEEPQEGEEEAATAEVEAEEAEGNEDMSPRTGSDGANSVAVSNLKLTARATAALAHRLPAVSAIAFTFTLSARSSVHLTIVRQMSTSGREHWSTLPDSLTLSLAKGHTARSLKGHNRLSAGRYRLTLKPAGGPPRSIYLSVQS